jgi:cytochrome c556
MKRILTGLTCGAMLALMAGASGLVAADDPPSIKEIMKKAHSKTGLVPTVGKQLKEKDVKWDDVKKESKEIIELGTALGKNKPGKGEGDSWDKLTKAYVSSAEDLSKAAENMDAKAATTAQGKLQGSCMSCHKAHR